MSEPIETSAETLALGLLADCRQLINEAKQSATVAVNASLTRMYWQIGERIRVDLLGGERAAYGKAVLPRLSKTLVLEYGRGFEEKNLRRMVQFAEAFPDQTIVATLWRQLSWSHFRVLLPLKQPLQRAFYAEMCCIERWSVRTLRRRVDSMLFERTALPPKAVLEQRLHQVIMNARLRLDNQHN